MMNKIRVLVVDDSAVVRKLISRALDGDPDVEVVGIAANGSIALARIEQLAPDLVTLDLLMPDMDGLETLVEIRKRYPSLPVIMVSSLTERGASETIEALSLGATDYVLKPVTRDIDMTMEVLREDLLGKIRALGRPGGFTANLAATRDFEPLAIAAATTATTAPAVATVGASSVAATTSGGVAVAARAGVGASTGAATGAAMGTNAGLGAAVGVRAVVIAVSTGGPQALASEVPRLPGNLPFGIVIVQHMPAEFTGRLAERLNAVSQSPVREVVAGTPLEGGSIWIAPGDQHVVIRGTRARPRLELSRTEPENSCRPSADVLFRSAAAVLGASVLGMVWTGMGQDGLAGAREIVAAGGQVWAQDKRSSVVWGMPGAVANAGLAKRVLPLQEFVPALCALVGIED
ncbi:MAG: chemotaxis response regulator protein-glutamate methylesterase [Deltaproteobacteria bacterium]|nr:chemotaxis response regulator protein-glutamate methylesterase [Deltaproteobacteria bacterium]